MKFEDDKLYGTNGAYHCLFIPMAEKYPESIRKWIAEAKTEKFPVYQVCMENKTGIEVIAPVVTLEETAKTAENHNCKDIEIAEKIPYLRYYHYIHEKDNMDIHMFFNESVLQGVDTVIKIPVTNNSHIYVYEPYENLLIEGGEWKNGEGRLRLEPAETLYLVVTDGVYAAKKIEKVSLSKEEIAFEFEISATYYQTPEQVEYIDKASKLRDFFKWKPDFAGYIYYKTWMESKEGKCLLDLGMAYEAVEVLVNDISTGVKINAPYRYDLTGLLNQSNNEIVIKIATSLVYAQCDPISENAVISPMGLLGLVTFWSEEKRLI